LICIGLPLRTIPQVAVASPTSTAKDQRVQPYSGTIWTTITQKLPDGSKKAITQRTTISQDAQGQWTKTFYKFTNGAQYDTSAPLAHTDTGKTTPLHSALAPSLSSGETLELDEDLGTRIENGLTTQGRRRTYLSVDKQQTTKHILETWYSPVLGAVVHSTSQNFNGTVVTSDLTNVQLGGSSASSAQTASSRDGSATAQQAPDQFKLYRALFSIVAHMERARLADPASKVGNMVAVEDSLRTKMNLSRSEWQSLVTTAVRVDADTVQTGQQARAFAQQKQAEGAKSGNATQALAAVRATLRQMQADQNGRILKAIQDLETNVGTGSAAKMHVYLQGPLAASAQIVSVKPQSGVAR
jgi:hypothetical protein